MFDGKMKAVTFSYDDGVTQDMRFIELLDKYRLKGTFNINSEWLGRRDTITFPDGKVVDQEKIPAQMIKEIYKNHEVAVHTLTHPLLTELPESEIVRQIEEDRVNLEMLTGKSVVGMAYPCGGKNYDERVVDIIRAQTKIKYARTIESNHGFDMQTDLLTFKPTGYTNPSGFSDLFALAEEFLNLKPDSPKILYIWGHSYEFDYSEKLWQEIEELFKLLSGKDDIFYGTNREVLL